MQNDAIHRFHIPVLGVGFSVDAPLKVARYGISSVMSIIADSLLEELRKHYLEKNGREYIPIPDDDPDSRALRITAYLDLIDELVKKQFTALKSEGFGEGSDLHTYFDLLPDDSELKSLYRKMRMTENPADKKKLQNELLNSVRPGSADVNIMTKIDKPNFAKDGTQLPSEYNDAHAALRGFANSKLSSSVVFSAGMNPRLYGYMEHFDGFFPDDSGRFNKRIIIKVSDYRSAVIQGRFLAKKGLWVSEFRIESGLNCGGHAFATDGLLLGPILEEFKTRRGELYDLLLDIYLKALQKKVRTIPDTMPRQQVSVQGGIGTCAEQDFLIRHYNISSVGWGTPFLLVPEVTNVDKDTLRKLSAAKEDDLYLSGISPLGVPFNNLRDNNKDLEKMDRVFSGKPGSPCTKKYLRFNTEFTEKPICTASIRFIKHKVKELKEQIADPEEFAIAYDKTVEKTCICEGLTVSVLTLNDIEVKTHSAAASVCPGPNMAYFSKITTLREMVDHIYGRVDLIDDSERPNMFVKELRLYINYLQDKMKDAGENEIESSQYFSRFADNLKNGIAYYKKQMATELEIPWNEKQQFLSDLREQEEKLYGLVKAAIQHEPQTACV